MFRAEALMLRLQCVFSFTSMLGEAQRALGSEEKERQSVLGAIIFPSGDRDASLYGTIA